MKKILLAALLLFTSSAQVQASDTIYQLQYKNDDGAWIEGKYYEMHLTCKRMVIREANDRGWKLDRFRCAEVEFN